MDKFDQAFMTEARKNIIDEKSVILVTKKGLNVLNATPSQAIEMLFDAMLSIKVGTISDLQDKDLEPLKQFVNWLDDKNTLSR